MVLSATPPRLPVVVLPPAAAPPPVAPVRACRCRCSGAGGGGQPVHACQHNEHGKIRVDHGRQICVQGLQIDCRVIEIDAGGAEAADIGLTAVDGQVIRPATAKYAAGVGNSLAGILGAIAIDVIAKKELGCDSLDKEQLLKAVDGTILGLVPRRQRYVIGAVRSRRPRGGSGIEPIDDGISDRVGHVGQLHEPVVERGAGRIGNHEGVEIDLAGLVGDAEVRARAPIVFMPLAGSS